jgi:tetratricopeptide (TPR) repeat protein
MWKRVAALLFVALTISAPAHGAPQDDKRAAELFRQSVRAYRDGRFQEAVDLLLEARRLKAEAVLLYDLGRAYEGLGNPSEAADAYARYLDEAPNASDRKALEGRIATLRRQAEELKRAEAPPPPAPSPAPPPSPPPPPPAPEETRSDPLAPVPWVVGGVGVVAVGTGLVFGLIARSRYDDASSDPSMQRAADKYDGAKHDAVIANVAFVTGAVLLVTAGVWLALRATSKPVPTRAALAF